MRIVYTTQYRYTPVCRDMIQPTAAYFCVHCYECKTRDHGTLYTLDDKFQVNGQSIGSYSDGRLIVACDMFRLALFEAFGQQEVFIDAFIDMLLGQHCTGM